MQAVFSYDPELRKWDSSMPPMRTGRTAARLVRLICGQLLAIGEPPHDAHTHPYLEDLVLLDVRSSRTTDAPSPPLLVS